MEWSDVFQRVAPTWWESLAIAAAIVALLWLTLRLRAWFRDDAADDDNAIHLLADLRDLYEQGGLTEEEFRSIKTRLAQAAAGSGPSQTKVPTTYRPVETLAAKTAAPEPSATSLNGRSDLPEQGLIGTTATDATEVGPGRATS